MSITRRQKIKAKPGRQVVSTFVISFYQQEQSAEVVFFTGAGLAAAFFAGVAFFTAVFLTAGFVAGAHGVHGTLKHF